MSDGQKILLCVAVLAALGICVYLYTRDGEAITPDSALIAAPDSRLREMVRCVIREEFAMSDKATAVLPYGSDGEKRRPGFDIKPS